MKYIEFDIPETYKTRPIEQFDPKMAKDFFRWFLSIIDERIKMLEYAVQQTVGFENWKADFTPDSLNRLQLWFEPQIKERTLTEDELTLHKNIYKDTLIEEDMRNSPIPVWTLTGETIRLAVDAGIYFSEVFIHNNPSLHWGQNTKSKLYIYKNYPLVEGFKGVDISPFFIVRKNMIYLYKRKEKFTWKDQYLSRLQNI